jgi:hypothetical protein
VADTERWLDRERIGGDEVLTPPAVFSTTPDRDPDE